MKKQTLITQLIIVIAIVLIANVLSNQLYFRLDFTEDKRYTLSKATKNILKDLDDVVTVKAYFSEDLPPQLTNHRRDLEDMLIEYENYSSGNVVYEFINPDKDKEEETKVQQKGIRPVMINVRENDRIEQLRAYMGILLQMGNTTETIPIIQPGTGMEYSLTTSIKKLSIQDKPKVGFIQGHSETSLATIQQLTQQLSVLYSVEPVDLTEVTEISNDYRAMAWVAPKDTIDPSHLNVVSDYLDNGGKLFVAYTNVEGDLQTSSLTQSPDIGFTGWLEQHGITIGRAFLVDAQCATVNVIQQQQFFRINSQIEFPFFPRITNFEDHPVVKGLDEVMFQFVTHTVATGTDTTLSYTALAFSSENSGFVNPPNFVNVQKRWNENDFTAGVQPVALAVEGIGKNNTGKIVIVGNGSFFENGEGQQARQIAPDHVNLASNAIDWLADDTGLIGLRTKGITSRPIDSVEDTTKNLIKYGNVFAPILLLLIYAFVRRMRNQRKRQQWMQGNYQ